MEDQQELDIDASKAETRCPPWCTREHSENDHPEDYAHYSDHHSFPVVVPIGAVYEQHGATGTEFIVGIRRFTRRDETWVFIGAGEDTRRSIEISLESAHRLRYALEDLLSVAAKTA